MAVQTHVPARRLCDEHADNHQRDPRSGRSVHNAQPRRFHAPQCAHMDDCLHARSVPRHIHVRSDCSIHPSIRYDTVYLRALKSKVK